jgi:hypothetical protein
MGSGYLITSAETYLREAVDDKTDDGMLLEEEIHFWGSIQAYCEQQKTSAIVKALKVIDKTSHAHWPGA